MGKIIDILKDANKQGYSSAEIKTTIIDVLSPYFENHKNLEKFALDNILLSSFEYVIRYHYEQDFFKGLQDVLDCYRKAYNYSPQGLLNVISTKFESALQKDTLMWSLHNNAPTESDSDKYSFLITSMKHIGDVLEVGLKFIITEIYCAIKLQNGEKVNCEEIFDYKFASSQKSVLFTGLL